MDNIDQNFKFRYIFDLAISLQGIILTNLCTGMFIQKLEITSMLFNSKLAK